MTHKIKAIEPKENLILHATFFDGTIKKYNIREMFSFYPLAQALNDINLFRQVQVDAGGYGVSWNADLDLDAETIWEDGITIGKENVDPVYELAAKLSEARENKGITQKQLAEKTGIYQGDISRIERGLANPSLSTLKRLANGMDMKLNISFMAR
ncbi:MAG: DUF2442 domain-containing protein [Clostridiales bacterium]|nr:DUF2442 domain-containing protein [Clostridiales bacterium]